MSREIKGVVVPLVTPLDESENIDVLGVRKLIDYLVVGKVQGLFLLGTTGEYTRLSDIQKKIFVDVCVEHVQDRLPFGINISGQGTRQILASLKFAEKYNPDFVALTPPDYFPFSTTDEQYDFFCNIMHSTDLPVMLYNIPGCTGGYINVDCIEKLLAEKNFVGFKDSSGNLEYIRQIVELTTGREFSIFNGYEKIFAQTMEMGCHGIISSAANVIPGEVVALCEACLTGDTSVWQLYYPLLEILHDFKQKINDNTNGIYILKYLLSRKSICQTYMAQPFRYCLEKERVAGELCGLLIRPHCNSCAD